MIPNVPNRDPNDCLCPDPCPHHPAPEPEPEKKDDDRKEDE